MAELKVRASLDGAQFQSGLNKMGSAAGGVLGGIKSQIAAAFTVGAVTALASKTMAYADSLQEMGQRIGVSSRALQEWSFAAKQSGADTEKMVTFIERLTDAASDLKNAKGFTAIGINPAGMTPEQLFTSVQSKTAGKSSTEIQSMMQGLGLSIRQIGPMVNMLQDDLAAASESARKMGAVMSDETQRRLAALNDQIDALSSVALVAFGDAFLNAADALMDGAEAYLEFIDRKISGEPGKPGDGGGMGFAQKWGKRGAGIVSGGLGLWNILGESLGVPGAAEKAEERIAYANEKFVETGWTGFIDSLAEIALKQSQNGGLAGRFRAIRAKLAKTSAPPSPSTINPIGGGDGVGRFRAGGDSLLSVGNFLGAGRNVVESIAKEQLRVQKEIASSTKILADASKKPPGTITV